LESTGERGIDKIESHEEENRGGKCEKE
jgi:hypothetical protein